MNEISLEDGIAKTLDALYADRLALVCGAGLSMAPPSSLPSAAALAWKAKQKYDATFGADRPPLPDAIGDQAQFFFDRHELDTVYLRTYIDRDDFAAAPNAGHLAAADLLLTGGITNAISTNVDTLIELAGNLLFTRPGSSSRVRPINCRPAHLALSNRDMGPLAVRCSPPAVLSAFRLPYCTASRRVECA